jgi:dephospho-CoA kinase
MFEGKPIIGIVGGIGSGKSLVARLFGELGCLVIDSDAQVREAYAAPAVKATLREWWGPEVFRADGDVDRAAIARRVFPDPTQRQRLERLLHPLVDEARRRAMQAAADDPRGTQVLAFVWDTPLLFEVGLDSQCDAVVFVEAPDALRLARVRQNRGWDEAELARREKFQWPLDKKKALSDHVVTNTADADDAREQVRLLLSRILAAADRDKRATGAEQAEP